MSDRGKFWVFVAIPGLVIFWTAMIRLAATVVAWWRQ